MKARCHDYALAVLIGVICCAGCVRSADQLMTEPAYTIRNHAVAHYGFGDAANLNVISNTVELRVRQPVLSDGVSTMGASLSAVEANAVTTVATSNAVQEFTTLRAGAVGTGADADVDADSGVGRVTHEQGRASAEALPTDHEYGDRRDVASIGSASSLPSIGGHTSESTIDVTDDRGTSVGAAAGTGLSADARRPVLTKTVSIDETLVGDRIEFVLELVNDSGLPLQSVTITDELDPHLAVDAWRVSVRPPVGTALIEDGLLTVTLRNTLKRGRSVRVRIPATVRPSEPVSPAD